MAALMHPTEDMRSNRSWIVAIAVLGVHAVTAGGAAAQQRPAEPTTWTSREGIFESRELIGMRIKDAEGKSLGEIEGLMVDPNDGRVSHAVVALSAFLGVGERKVVVPWSQLNIARVSEGVRLTARMDGETLLGAPLYEPRADAERTPSASPATQPPTPPIQK